MESIGGPQQTLNIKLGGSLDEFKKAVEQFSAYPNAMKDKAFLDALVNIFENYTLTGGKAKHAGKDFPVYAKENLETLAKSFEEHSKALKRTPQKEMKKLTKTLVELGVIQPADMTANQKMAVMMANSPGGFGNNALTGLQGNSLAGLQGTPQMQQQMMQQQMMQQMMSPYANQMACNPMMIFQQFPGLGKLFGEYCKITDTNERDVAKEKLNLANELSAKILEYNKYFFAKKAFLEGKKEGMLSLNHLEVQLLKTKATILEISAQLGLQAV